MIFDFIIVGLINVFTYVFSQFGEITQLPFGADDFLVSAINNIFAFLNVFWPLQPVMTAVLFYMGYKALMLLLRMIIGARIPVNYV